MASGIWDGYDRLKGGVVALGSAGGMEESGWTGMTGIKPATRRQGGTLGERKPTYITANGNWNALTSQTSLHIETIMRKK